MILCLHRISECYCACASTSSQNSVYFSRIAQFVFLLMEPDDQVSSYAHLCILINPIENMHN